MDDCSPLYEYCPPETPETEGPEDPWEDPNFVS
jgi:hypothetical protein